MSLSPTKSAGDLGEQQALSYLLDRGLTLVARNYHCRYGELDLVLLDQNEVVFVEVKFRKQNSWVHGVDSVDSIKQQKLIRAAEWFLSNEEQFSHYPARFDVVAVTGKSNPQITWVRNAFES